MALDPQHWTEKVSTAFQEALVLAAESGQQEAHPVHLAISLFEDDAGLAKQVRSVNALAVHSTRTNKFKDCSARNFASILRRLHLWHSALQRSDISGMAFPTTRPHTAVPDP